MTWDARKVLIAICFFVLASVAGASLALFWRGGADHPSVPEAGTTVQTQTAVNSAVRQVQETREKSDERIRKAYQDARKGVDCLSADAVVSKLNALLDELRQRDAE